MHTVISRATCDNKFVDYYEAKSEQEPRLARASVLVRGRANTCNKFGLVIPCGVTYIEDDAAVEFLEKNPTFQEMKKAGFMEIVKGKQSDAESAELANGFLKQADGSAPLTEARMKEIGERTMKTATEAAVPEYGALVMH